MSADASNWVGRRFSDRIAAWVGDQFGTSRPKTKAGEFRRLGYRLSNEMNCKRDRLLELSLGHRFEAACANIAPNAAAVLIDSSPLNIRPELTLRLPLGEAHILTAHRPLATYITFRHNFTLPDARLGGVQTKGDRLGRPNIS